MASTVPVPAILVPTADADAQLPAAATPVLDAVQGPGGLSPGDPTAAAPRLTAGAGAGAGAGDDEARTVNGTPTLGAVQDKEDALPTHDSSTKASSITPGPASPSTLTPDTSKSKSNPEKSQPGPTTVAPPTPAATATPAPKKRSGFAAFFLACIPCASNDAHAEPSSSATVAGPSKSAPAALSDKAASPLNEKALAPAPAPSPSPPAPAAAQSSPVAGTTPSVPTSDDSDASKQAEESAMVAATVASNTSRAGATLSQEETEGVTSGAVMPPGKESPAKGRRRRSGKNGPESLITSVPEPGQRQVQRDSDDSDEDASDDDDEDDDDEDEEQGLIARGGVGIPIGEDGLPHPLLDELAPELKGRKCLVLDLDETLVHSSFKQMVHQADYVVPVEIENQYHNVYVIKRPGVDGFLKAMGEIYEVVIFTASLSKYADPVLDQLDIHRVVKHRLFRESCYNNKGSYVKDLSQLGRPMSECIIIDNSPASYVFHPNNAVPISSWFNDPHDTELTDLVPFLTDLERVDDVRGVLDAGLYQHLA